MAAFWNERRFKKPRKISAGLLAVIMSLVLLLTGCIPENYTSAEEAAFLAEAEEVVSDYLADNYKGAVVTQITAQTTVSDDPYGLSLTSFASGTFSWQDETYSFAVSTRTGEVFTSVLKDEIVGRLLDDLLQAFHIDAQETQVHRCSIYLRASNLEEGIALQNVFPDGETADEVYEKIINNTGEYSFSYITLLYKGEDLPPIILKEDSPFPTLSSVNIYHIADEYGFVKYNTSFLSELPCFSAEILQLDFSADTSEYTRNQVWERDGFQIIYNAYEKTEKQGTVTESVITDEDISLTVTEGYIALDCTKKNVAMYLSAADEEMVKEYLYYYPYPASNEISEGVWYAYEGRYFFDGDDLGNIRTPNRFTGSYPVNNIIYTEFGIKKPVITPKPPEKVRWYW